MIRVAPRWAKAMREVSLHPGRSVIVVLAMAVGLVGAGAVLDKFAILEPALERGFLATNPASATLYSTAVDGATLGRIGELPGVTAVQARREVSGSILVDGARLPLRLFVHDDFAGLRIGLLAPVAGAWPPGFGQLVIERSVLPFANLELGTLVEIALEGAPVRPVRVAGLVRDSGLAPAWMEHVVYGYVTRETLASFGLPAEPDCVQIVVGDERESGGLARLEEVRRTAFRAAALLEASGRPVLDVVVAPPGVHPHAAQMNSLLYAQLAFGVLALLAGGLLIFNLQSALLAGQSREIAILKTIGARRSQIVGVYLAPALLWGLAALAIALPAAAWIGRSYANFTAGFLNFDLASAPLPFWAVALQIGVGLGLPLGAAGLAVRRGVRVPIASGLSDLGLWSHAFGGRRFDRFLGRVQGTNRPLALALRNTFRRRGRLALTLTTLAVGGAVFLGALDVRSSVRATVAEMFAALRHDLVVSLERSESPARIESAVAGVAGLDAVEAFSATRATVGLSDGTRSNSFSLSGVAAEGSLLSQPIASGRWLRAGDREALVVNQALALDAGLALGDEVVLVLTGQRSTWRVAGITASAPTHPAAFVEREALAAAPGGTAGANRLAVAAAELPESFLRALEQALDSAGFGVRSLQLVAEQRASMESHVVMVVDLLLVMALVITVVGGFGLATSMNLAVLERRRELGILRTIGATPRVLRRMVLVEGLVIGLLSCVAAVPLSLLASAVVGATFGRIFFRVPLAFRPSLAGLALWFALVALLSVLSTLQAARRAARATPAQAMAAV